MKKRTIWAIILGACGVIVFIWSLNIDSSIISALVLIGAIALIISAIIICD